jgi:hypothetical protein
MPACRHWVIWSADVVLAAASAHIAPPTWSTALLWSGFAVWVVWFIADFKLTGRSVRRRAYWVAWLGAALLVSLGLLYDGWGAALGIFAFLAFLTVFRAIRDTPYLKVRGRVIALWESDRRDGALLPIPTFPRPLGDGSGPKLWWLVVGDTVLVAAVAVALGWCWQLMLNGGLLAALVAFYGLDDGRRRFPVARRQYLQVALVVALSIPLLELPMLVYLLAYAIGKLRPMTYSRHDAEARYYHPDVVEPASGQTFDVQRDSPSPGGDPIDGPGLRDERRPSSSQ